MSEKNILIGTWAEIPSAYVTNVMSKAGFDFSIVDMEHGVIDFNIAQNMVFAAHAAAKQIYIRVPAIEESWVTRVLDTGCEGIIFPGVSTLDDVKEIVRICHFAPEGERGFNPFVPAGNYHKVPSDYFQTENERIKVGIILEGKKVFSQLDEILSIPQIDVIYIGQYDLSISLGIPGDVSNPKVTELMEITLQKACLTGKSVGCMVHSVQEANKAILKGFSFIVYKVDCNILYDSINQFLAKINDTGTCEIS